MLLFMSTVQLCLIRSFIAIDGKYVLQAVQIVWLSSAVRIGSQTALHLQSLTFIVHPHLAVLLSIIGTCAGVLFDYFNVIIPNLTISRIMILHFVWYERI